MRHFYRFFAFLLLTIVGVATMAAQVAPGFYRIRSNRDSKFVVLNGAGLSLSSGTSETANNLSEIWKLEADGDGFRMVSAQAALPVQKQAQNYQTHSVGATAGRFYFRNDGAYVNISYDALFSGYSLWHNDGNNKVVVWQSGNNVVANQWTLMPATATEVAMAEANLRLHDNQVVRLKSQGGKYAAVDGNGKLILLDAPDNSDMSDIWVVENAGATCVVRNYKTGFSFSNDGDATTQLSTNLNEEMYYLHLSDSGNGRIHIGRSGTLTESKFLQASADGKVVIAAAKTNGVTNAATEWTLESIVTPTFDQAKTNIRQKFGYAGAVVSGNYYRLVSRPYTRHAKEMVMTGNIVGVAADETDYAQVWKIETLDTKFSIQNAVSQKYINNNAGTSAYFQMSRERFGFNFNFVDRIVPFLSIGGTQQGLHCAKTQGYHLVGWSESAEASKWYLLPTTVNDDQLAAARAKLSMKNDIEQNRDAYNARLASFFADNACTRLKETYKSMDEAQLRNEMSGLPEEVIGMAVRVLNNRWHTNDLANRYEKDFRLADYQAHSDPKKWSQRELLPVMGSYSRLSNPTGISGREGETVLVYVDDNAPTGTTLKAELVSGFDATGTQVELNKGINALYFERNQHIYIYYNIDDTNIKWAEVPKMKVHIEGGYANGCYNYERHTNADWTALQSLKNEGFLQDEVFRIKSRRQCFSFHLNGIEARESAGDFHDYDGTYKGIAGIIGLWDNITDIELDFLSVDKVADRFNGLLFASSAAASYPYATTYGTWYPGVSTIFSYKEMSRGKENDEAGNRWAVAHEIGHQFQQLFNMAACTESSNNLFSQVIIWKTGASVSRGLNFKQLSGMFNQGQNWTHYGIGERIRLYWQLWLYYVELGNKPNFYRELIDKLRQEPLQHGNANTDFLRFARHCADVAQEDLTDFFTLHGFFNIEEGRHQMFWKDDFYDNNYAKVYTQVSTADIEATKAHMRRYPKGRANNLYFIEERINKEAATYKGAEYGVMRLGTSKTATPGDASEVGDVGMYTDFAPNAATQAQPKAVEVEGQTVSIQAPGAVGYKVYDANGNLVFVANTNVFTVPAQHSPFTIKVAGGDGGEVTVVENGQVLAAYQHPVVDERFENTASLAVSSNKSNPEYLYTIRNAAQPTYYANANTSSTTNSAEAGKFAFFPAGGKGQYRIAALRNGGVEWLTCSNYGAGAARIGFSTDFSAATTWTIRREYNDANFDIIAGGDVNNNSWNWYGGIGNNTTNTMGLYGKYNDLSSWTLTPTTEKASLAQAIAYAQQTESRVGVGYPTTDATQRAVLKAAIAQAEAKLNGSVVQSDVTTLNGATEAYRANRTSILAPEDGKVYVVRHFADQRYLSNAPVGNETLCLVAQPNNSVLWIAQKVGEKYLMAAYKADGYLAKKADATRGAMSTTPAEFEVASGTLFGANYLNVDSRSLSGNRTLDYVEMVAHRTYGNNNNRSGTDFYFEEVKDMAYKLNFAQCDNANIATLYLPFAVQLPEGVKAYAAAQPVDDVVKLTPYAGNVLPARTAAVLTATSAGEQPLPPAPYAAPENLGWEGSLKTIANSTLDKAAHIYYALRKVGGSAVLAQIGTANIPANRAYLVVPAAGGGVQKFTFLFEEDIVTTLDAVAPATPALERSTPLYDLSGRRVQRPVRGQIYLQNGRKMVF